MKKPLAKKQFDDIVMILVAHLNPHADISITFEDELLTVESSRENTTTLMTMHMDGKSPCTSEPKGDKDATWVFSLVKKGFTGSFSEHIPATPLPV